MNTYFHLPWIPAGPFAENLAKELKCEVTFGHPLWGKNVSAIARRTDSDDVLFEIEGSIPGFAVVHLTWSSEPEEDSRWPDVKFFSSMQQWIHDSMIPDSKEFMGETE